MEPRTILLVEDHHDSAVSLARVLGKLGHGVSIAASVAEAKALAAGKHFDIAVCDLGLPDGDGCDLMRELIDRYSLPGIALTGYDMPDDERRVASAGFAAHVVKPIALDKFLTVLENVITVPIQPLQTPPGLT